MKEKICITLFIALAIALVVLACTIPVAKPLPPEQTNPVHTNQSVFPK